MFDITKVSPATLRDLESMTHTDLSSSADGPPERYNTTNANYVAVTVELRRRDMSVRDLLLGQTDFDPWENREYLDNIAETEGVDVHVDMTEDEFDDMLAYEEEREDCEWEDAEADKEAGEREEKMLSNAKVLKSF